MQALDTNVLACVILRDDEAQFQRATKAMSAPDLFVPVTVLLETAWLLSKSYRLPKTEVVAALQGVTALPNVRVDRAPEVDTALNWAAAGMDVADALHLALSREADSLLSFDHPLARQADRLGASPRVVEP